MKNTITLFKFIFVVFFTFTLALVSCASEDDDDGGGGPDNTAEITVTAEAGAAYSDTTLSIAYGDLSKPTEETYSTATFAGTPLADWTKIATATAKSGENTNGYLAIGTGTPAVDAAGITLTQLSAATENSISTAVGVANFGGFLLGNADVSGNDAAILIACYSETLKLDGTDASPVTATLDCYAATAADDLTGATGDLERSDVEIAAIIINDFETYYQSVIANLADINAGDLSKLEGVDTGTLKISIEGKPSL